MSMSCIFALKRHWFYAYPQGSVDFVNCTFANNTGARGAAVFINGGVVNSKSTPAVTVSFTGWVQRGWGGGYLSLIHDTGCTG